MAYKTTTLFLDVDGVLAAHSGPFHGGLDPVCMKRLKQLIDRHRGWRGQIQVVLNSAWSARGLEEVRDLFEPFGIDRDILVGTTDSYQGGGDPVRRYLIENNLVGKPYVIIDDSTHNYGPLWARLIPVDGSKGLTDEDSSDASALMWRAINGVSPLPKLRRDTTSKMLTHCGRIAAAKWLTVEQRYEHIHTLTDLIAYILTAPDLMQQALLIPPPEDPTPSASSE